MTDRMFDLSAPWKIDDDAEMILTVNDKRVPGSRRYFIRFDLYPLHSPSHPDRHHGFWDVPMKRIRKSPVRISFNGDKIRIEDEAKAEDFPAVWRSGLPITGACTLTVSILDRWRIPVRTAATQSYRLLFLGAADIPLAAVLLHVTTRCNASCHMCRRESFADTEQMDADPKVIDAVIDQAPQLKAVILQGDGEPLLNPHLPEIATRLKTRMPATGKVGLYSNGMLFDEQTSRKFIDLGVDWFTISMDGARKSTQERIRRGCRFDTVVTHVARAVKYAGKFGAERPQLNLQFTIREDNVDEIPEFVRLAANLGVDNVIFGHLQDYSAGEFLVIGEDRLGPLYREATEAAEKLGVTVSGMPVRELNPPRCPHLDDLFVYATGETSPCRARRPGSPEAPAIVLGNVKEKSLPEIWSGHEARQLRKRLISDVFSQACRSCQLTLWGAHLPLGSSPGSMD